MTWLLLLVLCFVALAQHATGQSVVNLYVSPTGSDGNTCTTAATSCLSISGAITQAQYSATNNIYVADGVYSGASNTNLQFGTKAINLQAANGAAANVVLDGGKTTTILSHNAVSLTAGQLSSAGLSASSTSYVTSSISNILLRNGYSASTGGAVAVTGLLLAGTTFNTFNQFIFNNCTFTSNTGKNGGGAVYSLNAMTGNADALQFNGCTFTNNMVTSAFSALQNAGTMIATVTLLNTSASFYGCLFNYNSVPGLLLSSNITTASVIYNTTFINSTATALAVAGTHTLTQTLTTIANHNMGSRSITDLFSGSMAYTSTGLWLADRCVWNNATVSVSGSVPNAHLYSTLSTGSNITASLTNCQFLNGNGYRAAAGTIPSGTMNFTNCTFFNNTGTQLGSVLFFSAAQSVTYFSNCSFLNNSGNAILYTYNGALSLFDSCTFVGNNGLNQAGTAFYIQPVNPGSFYLTVQSSEFSDNVSGGNALISIKYTQLASGGSFIQFINNSFTNNTGDGGAILSLASDGNAALTGCNFTNNTAAATGGAVETNIGSQLSISNCLFEGNSASSQGGAVYDSALSFYSGNTFIGNSAGSSTQEGFGGAVFIADILLNAYNAITDASILSTDHRYATCATALTNNNQFIGNEADVGAAIYIDGEYPLCYSDQLCLPGAAQCSFQSNVAASNYGNDIGMILDSIQVLHVNQFSNSSIAELTTSRIGQYQYATAYLGNSTTFNALSQASIYPGLGFDLFVLLLDKNNNTYSFYNTYVPVLQLAVTSSTPFNSSSASSMETNGGLAVFTNNTIYATPGNAVTANFLVVTASGTLQTSIQLSVSDCPTGYILNCNNGDLLCGCIVRPAYLVGEQISSSVASTGLVLSMLLYVVGSYATSMCWQRSLETLSQANSMLARYTWITITAVMLGVILTWCPAVLAVSEVSLANLSADVALDGRWLLISLAISAVVSFCCLTLLLHHPAFKVVQRNRVTVGEDSYTLASENDSSVGSRSNDLKRDSVGLTNVPFSMLTVRTYVQTHLPLMARFFRLTLAKAKKWQLIVAAVLMLCNTICCNFLVLYSVTATATQSTSTSGVAVSLALGITLYLLLIPMFIFHRGSHRWVLTILFSGALMVLNYLLLYGQTYRYDTAYTNGFGTTSPADFQWVPATLFLVSLVLGLMAALFCFAIVVSYMQLSRFELTQRVLQLQQQEAEDLRKTRKTVDRISHTNRLINVLQQSYQWPKADNIDKLASLAAAAEQPILRKLLTTYMQSARDGLADVFALDGWWAHLDSAPSLQFTHEPLSLAAVIHTSAARPYVLSEAATISYQALNAFYLLYSVQEFNRVVLDPSSMPIAFTLARNIVRQQLAVGSDFHTKPINNLLWFELERKLTTITRVELAGSVLSNKFFHQVEKALYKEAMGRWWPQMEKSSSGYIIHLLMKKQHVN